MARRGPHREITPLTRASRFYSVNFWQGMNVDFNTVFLGTWAGCGVAFYTGLRAGRVVMPWMPDGDYRNLKNDASLSAAIGGATAVFVGTDTAYNPDQNWLKDVSELSQRPFSPPPWRSRP